MLWRGLEGSVVLGRVLGGLCSALEGPGGSVGLWGALAPEAPGNTLLLLLFSRSVTSDSATPRTAAHQAPLSTGFSRQEHWSGSPFPSLEDLPDPGIKHEPPAWQVDSLPLSHLRSPINTLGKSKSSGK